MKLNAMNVLNGGTVVMTMARKFCRITGLLALLLFSLKPPSICFGLENGLDVRRQCFEKVWSTIKEKHFDTNFAGVDWDQVKTRYEPRLAELKSDSELYGLLGQMLGELKQTHFGIVPPDALPGSTSRESSEGVPGMKFSFIHDQVVVTHVLPGFGAAAAGVKSGWVLERIEGIPIDRRLEPLNRSAIIGNLKHLYRKRLVDSWLDGPEGSFVKCRFLDGRDNPKEFSIRRKRLNGEMSPALGNFPPQYTEFESRRLPGNIGYIRFNIFVIPQMEKVRNAIRSYRGARGLIIDLRDNPGGVAGMAMGMGGLLMNREASLGTMRMRSGQIFFAMFPQERPYLGPLVVLVDHGSASTSEIFAAGLQDLKRARVVGEPTAGAALPSMFEKLPTGALFQFAFGDFRTSKGFVVEGRGVIPDVRVVPRREDWLKGRDTQLIAALEEIEWLVASEGKPAVPSSVHLR